MDKAKSIENLREFRKKFGGELSDTNIKYIFMTGTDIHNYEGDTIWERKMLLAKEYSKALLFLDWVKFIAVTGSVAAEVAKEGDDIDIYVVVKNNRMWLYRGLMMVNPKLIGALRRVGGVSERDRICLNLISEERGVCFEEDVFNFHELFFMKPIYNPEYKGYILRNNEWVTKFGGVIERISDSSEKRKSYNLLLTFFDFLAFLSQFLFMFLTNHNPEYNRLLENNRRGRIEFFKLEFKKKILRNG